MGKYKYVMKFWAEHSRKGEVCGILGCPGKPTGQCNHCGNHYCHKHRNAILEHKNAILGWSQKGGMKRMDEQPTVGEVIAFWEWFGCKISTLSSFLDVDRTVVDITFPDGKEQRFMEYLLLDSITPNNLFKYVVPKLKYCSLQCDLWSNSTTDRSPRHSG